MGISRLNKFHRFREDELVVELGVLVEIREIVNGFDLDELTTIAGSGDDNVTDLEVGLMGAIGVDATAWSEGTANGADVWVLEEFFDVGHDQSWLVW